MDMGRMDIQRNANTFAVVRGRGQPQPVQGGVVRISRRCPGSTESPLRRPKIRARIALSFRSTCECADCTFLSCCACPISSERRPCWLTGMIDKKKLQRNKSTTSDRSDFVATLRNSTQAAQGQSLRPFSHRCCFLEQVVEPVIRNPYKKFVGELVL